MRKTHFFLQLFLVVDLDDLHLGYGSNYRIFYFGQERSDSQSEWIGCLI